MDFLAGPINLQPANNGSDSMISTGPDHWPRITMVTPVRNGMQYIEETIRSIVDQEYPNLEYIIVDGGSTDGTVDVIRAYEKHLTWWVSEPDSGMYDALNKGFARSTGEIMGWLNSSDRLHPKSLFVVGSVFAAFPEVEWINGRPTVLNSDGMTIYVLDLGRWSRYRFLAGANRFIQQESTLWRRRLWERAGGALDISYGGAGDFELWARYFRHAPLYPVDAPIGAYRMHTDSINASDPAGYARHCEAIVERELDYVQRTKALKAFRKLGRSATRIPKVRGVWLRVVMRILYKRSWRDWPSKIVFKDDQWVLRR
jgi:glycosyltransferase involved in cell wall biosynthesis